MIPESYKPPNPPARWDAQWIWHPPVDNMDNFHLLARRELKLDSAPKSASVWVTATSIYELFINGQSVGFGPSPSYPEWTYFDSYDVTRFLKPGANVIAARCYNFGPTMESVLLQDPGRGGFLLQLEVDGRPAEATGGNWRVLRDPSREPVTEPISGHRGAFKEVYDANLEVIGWQNPGFDDSAWSDAHVLGPVETDPWTSLIPREVPPLRLEKIYPQDVFYHTCGRAYGGERYDVTSPEALRSDDDSCAIVDPLKPDFSPSVILDFGVNAFGYFEVELADSEGGVVELSYGESLNTTVLDTWRMSKGPQTYRPVERRGGRYLMLTFKDCPGPVKIRRVVCYRRSYPVQHLGEFRCSDETLNRIWEVGKYTVQMCMQDHYEDCPFREEALYCGDIAVGAKLSYYAYGTQDLARKGLRQFARIQRANGLIPAIGPAPTEIGYLPEYPAFWVVSLWDYFIHWGDKDLLQELYPNLMRCMDWYHENEDENGLFARKPDEPNFRFVDNLSNLKAVDKLAAEQIIICEGIRRGAWIAREVGDSATAGELFIRGNRLAQTIEKLFWNPGAGLFNDTLIESEQSVTQITNGLALLYNTVSSERRQSVLKALLDPTLAPPMRAGYMNSYMVEALVHEARYQEALDRIREYWGGMLARGATTFWETFDPDSPDGTIPERLWSLCHEFCCGPVYSLPAHYAGIRALKPGFEAVEIAPKPTGLDWLRSKVPTPKGIIELVCCVSRETRSVDMDITIPAGVQLSLLVPLPGRELGTVYLNGNPVPPDARADNLTCVHPKLASTKTEAGGLRLLLGASDTELRLRVYTKPNRVFAPGGRIVAQNFGNWGQTPPGG